jgi:hypothetical protein
LTPPGEPSFATSILLYIRSLLGECGPADWRVCIDEGKAKGGRCAIGVRDPAAPV